MEEARRCPHCMAENTPDAAVCTRCGAMVEMRAAVFDALEALPTRYCPNCGAEVVS